MRPQLCAEALRLGRVLAALLPAEPEVQGLLALMEIQASRMGARTGPSGEPVLLLAQNRGRVFSRETLLARVWGARYEGGPRTVDIHVQGRGAAAQTRRDVDLPAGAIVDVGTIELSAGATLSAWAAAVRLPFMATATNDSICFSRSMVNDYARARSQSERQRRAEGQPGGRPASPTTCRSATTPTSTPPASMPSSAT